jgi:hypothetical protein
MLLPGGVKLAGLAHHLVDLGDMLLLEGDLFSGVFFKPHALVHYQRVQVVVLLKCSALVIQRFTQDLGDVMLWDSTSLPMLRDGCPPTDVTCSPAIAAWFMPSVAWFHIQPMIGMRAWPKTISE